MPSACPPRQSVQLLDFVNQLSSVQWFVCEIMINFESMVHGYERSFQYRLILDKDIDYFDIIPDLEKKDRKSTV